MRFAHPLDVESLQGDVGTEQILIEGHVEVPIQHLELAINTRLLYFRKVHVEQRIESLLNNILLLLGWQRQNLWIGLVLIVVIPILLIEVPLGQLLHLVRHIDLS